MVLEMGVHDGAVMRDDHMVSLEEPRSLESGGIDLVGLCVPPNNCSHDQTFALLIGKWSIISDSPTLGGYDYIGLDSNARTLLIW